MKAIGYVDLALTIEGNSKDYTLIEIEQTDYNERSMHADHTYQVVFKTKGGETAYICDVIFPFNINSELWMTKDGVVVTSKKKMNVTQKV